ncbi:MAG: tetratricopeptide repeat protein [Deltaproteobacteria bacterium]|nr:tetratricopeptide repeat protein [Deltaproteobacteria bacterium]
MSATISVIAKKYQVLKPLGVGAMGEVFLVLPPKGDPVALKLLKTLDAKSNKAAMEQFENEFQVLKRLSHPNIGHIIDYGFDEEQQKVFFTLPWLKGTDIFEATKDLVFEKCEEYFVQMFRALNYLHQKKLYHCDIKPANIVIEDGQVLLIDFGLSGYWGDNIVGTPTYLAPELFRGKHHNESSDLYAAGVLCYNCLTRTQPFSAKTLQEVYNRHRSFTPPPISDINPKVPKYFSDIIDTLLNKKPEERHTSAASVIEEIATYSGRNYSIETKETLLSYLPTESELIGRPEAIADMKKAIGNFLSEANKDPYHLILIHGQKNVGKTHFVTRIKHELQLSKFSVESIITPMSQQDRHTILVSKAIILENLDYYFMNVHEMKNLREIVGVIEQKILATTTTRFIFIVSSSKESEFQTIKKLLPLEETRITTIELSPYTLNETEEFLKNIIGEKEIPQSFVNQFYLNTDGLPGLALDLIQSMIGNGLLFDKSGRWTDDLLSQLDKTFTSMEVSESLEQEFEKIYDSLTSNEEDIVNWLSVSPHPLTYDNIKHLVKQEELDQTLEVMLQKKIIRVQNNSYTLYRSIFHNFIQKNLPNPEVKRRHTALALPAVGLSNKWRIYHLSLGSDRNMRLKAAEKLCDIYTEAGNREDALNAYLKMINDYADTDFQKRLDWHIQASILMIDLDRFQEVNQMITKLENEIQKDKPTLDHNKFMTLLEKKGIALLHLEKLDHARRYFENGLKYSKRFPECVVQQLRFENSLASIEDLLGNHEKAIQIFKRTRELSKQLAPAQLQQITNNDLGHVYVKLRKPEESIPYLIEDIKTFSPLKNKEPMARALYSYAEALRNKSETQKAVKAFQECVNICKAANYHLLLLRSYNGLGSLHQTNEQHDMALKNYQDAIDIAVRLKDYMAKAVLLFNQAHIYGADNNTALAARRFLLAKQILESKETKLLAYEEIILSKCCAELSYIALEDNNKMKALTYQLERQRLVNSSQALKAERFEVNCNLAELFLQNRLHDQFENELTKLETMAQTPEELKKLEKLKSDWNIVRGCAEQESTGKINIMED